ncbi:MAG: (deoxy)nucleoside triphosphate pyrophosphohydrolase [Sphingomonadales bacterium]|nr:(deoxy)nucleoside triphosphate pyrophosphohydrolase [Sphingomonadales bacterium]
MPQFFLTNCICETLTQPLDTLIVVAAALSGDEGRWLLQQRPEGASLAGLWEFPGGKIDVGEDAEMALRRELKEELRIDVASGSAAPIAFSTGRAGDRALVLLLYRIDEWQGEPEPLHATDLGWFTPEEMRELAMPAADIPLIASLGPASG